MRNERFSFTTYDPEQYQLNQQIEHNGLPAVVTHITKRDWAIPETEVSGIYGRVLEGVGIEGLTCEELAALGGDGHEWQRWTSLHDKNHWVACRYCGKVEDTGIPVTSEERARGMAEFEVARMKAMGMLAGA